MLSDECFVCSDGYIKKCLEVFRKRSEVEAIELIKKGKRPDKLIKK